jgi:hypothetical protein
MARHFVVVAPPAPVHDSSPPTGSRKLTDTVVARVVKARKPSMALAARWRRSFTAGDLDRITPGLSALLPAGTWDLTTAWPHGISTRWARESPSTSASTATPSASTPLSGPRLRSTATRPSSDTGTKDIGGFFCREDGPVVTYHISVSNDQLTLTPINEPCLQRQGVWASTSTRVG